MHRSSRGQGLKPPAGFATTRFNGLHAYFFVAPDGTRRAFRYSWSLVFTLGAPEDPTDDVSARRPAGRETVTAGTLRLLAPHEDQDEVERTVFDPTGVVPGIELTDDRGPRSGRSDGQPAAARPPSMVTMVPLM